MVTPNLILSLFPGINQPRNVTRDSAATTEASSVTANRQLSIPCP